MPKSRQAKEQMLNNFAEKWSRAEVAVVTQYSGLSVEQMETLRKELKKNHSEFLVVKNTLAKRVLDEAGATELSSEIDGQVGFALGYEEIGEAPKVLFDFAKENDKLVVTCGFAEGAVADASRVETWSKLPSRIDLLGSLVSSLQSPIGGLVSQLSAPIANLIGTLDALVIKRGEEG
jgi:ribosomal protein L10